MIIFGWGHVTHKDFGPTMSVDCPNCNNSTWLQLVRHRKWFTLFFIPVIPYHSRHLLLCNVCSRGIELAGDQVGRAMELNTLSQGFLNQEISEDKYLIEADKIKVLA